MTVVSAEYDFLRISSDIFVQRALNEGAKMRSMRYLGCDHGFMEKLVYCHRQKKFYWIWQAF